MTDSTAAGAKQGSVFEDILEVLWAPAAVFERSRSRGAGLYMLVLTVMIVVLLVATKSLIQPYVDANFDLQLIKMAEQGSKMPAEAVESGRWQPEAVESRSLPARFGFVRSPSETRAS